METKLDQCFLNWTQSRTESPLLYSLYSSLLSRPAVKHRHWHQTQSRPPAIPTLHFDPDYYVWRVPEYPEKFISSTMLLKNVLFALKFREGIPILITMRMKIKQTFGKKNLKYRWKAERYQKHLEKIIVRSKLIRLSVLSCWECSSNVKCSMLFQIAIVFYSHITLETQHTGTQTSSMLHILKHCMKVKWAYESKSS